MNLISKPANRLNVFEVQELKEPVKNLTDLVNSREELASFRTRLVEVHSAGYLSYREFMKIFFECARALSPKEAIQYEMASRQVDVMLNYGVAVLPVVRDEPMSAEDLIMYRAAFIYPLQLVSKPTKADGSTKTPWEFLHHDYLHSSLMFEKDIADGLIAHLNSFREPAEREQWIQNRVTSYRSILRAAETLNERERMVVTEVLLDLLHEWPPERKDPVQTALRELNRLGISSARDVRRGLLANKTGAANYLAARLKGVQKEEVKKAIDFIVQNLR